MGTTLTGTTPANTYDSLIKVTDNGPLSGTAKYLSDGLGNDSALALSTSKVLIGNTGVSAINETLNVTGAGIAIEQTDGGVTTMLGAFGSADTILGAFTNNDVVLRTNNTERMRITSSGNVGIGTASPANIGAGYTHLAISGATTGVLSIQSGTNRIFSLASIGDDGLLENRTATGSLKFRLATGTTEICAVTPNGLTFNGDTAAANALDDYEEGTWTMSATPSSSGTITLDSGVDSGYYTKIGRQVTCTGLAEVSSVSSPTGTTVRFSGLPFAIAPRISEYEMRIGGAVTYNGATVVATPFTGTEGATFVNVYIDASTVSAGNQFYFSFTYFV